MKLCLINICLSFYQNVMSKTMSWVRCHIHQHFMQVFFIQKCFFLPKRNYRKLREALSYKKRMHKMLMKLTPGSR